MASESITVRVSLAERAYEIHIGSGTIDGGTILGERLGRVPHAIVIADSRIADSYASRVAHGLAGTADRVDTLVVPSGESSKCVAELNRLWNELLRLGAGRDACVVAVGGGVIGDLGGFAAASYARGIPFAQVPTTLLSQVDSSVGGKVGINLPGAKNMVGAFWQPRFVLIDTSTLATLPRREFIAGLAEVVKYGVALDAAFLDFLEANTGPLLDREPSVLRRVIARCCEWKAAIVAEDERETTGLRAVLNYGHTFGHAVESLTGYGEYLHGEAVAIGMRLAARLAAILGRIDSAFLDRQDRLLDALGLPRAARRLEPDAMLAAMRGDKKASRGRLRFVLPSRSGRAELVDGVTDDQARSVLG
ncbi:MAG: 3-dehydroquinate synthase [Planctomycetes bacterium]|nr:3-dehydroquinate synthase [Planctomycetota bacterium]